MPRNGRPKLEEPKNKKISLRVSEKDYERIFAYAEKHKITVAELISKGVEKIMEETS
ncbi:MAG: hypothetical protein SPF19_14490 [Oliverpabstia sp.]|nr:hypothetical protein [Lachnospiraceae bacterium]MDY5027703.1 hypothetical protein [Oliverpabstia sp.]